MFYGNNTQDTRQFFFSSWKKYRNKQPLLPLEQEIVTVLLAHPEYQKTVEKTSLFEEHTYYPELGETNPFLHMGLHLAIREQVATDRPPGIKTTHSKLIIRYTDEQQVEHLMMECLAECLWLAQKNNTIPDDLHYLNLLHNLLIK